MGIRNYLIEGLSGTGKTSVCNELQQRGYHAVHGDPVVLGISQKFIDLFDGVWSLK